jgi:SNF2 family DNA or RNA helicase
MNRYKREEVNLLAINSRFYGSGLNLENTTDIIMFHKFDSEVEKQVIGRAQRMGREKALKVWYLLYDNEIHNGDVAINDETPVET